MIDAVDSEVIQWANSLVQAKTLAEQAAAAGNSQQLSEWRSYGDTARNRLQSLGFGWVASALSADGANAAQSRAYVASLQQHLANWAGDARATPALSLRDGLDGKVYRVSGAQVTTTSIGGAVANVFSGIGEGLQTVSGGARSEAKSWLGQVVEPALKVIFPALVIWGFVKVFRIRANVGR